MKKQAGTAPLWLLKLRPAGMFSNVNEVVEHLRLADAGEYQFCIDWTKSCYRDPKMSGDPWTYYFEPCFPSLADIPDSTADLPVLPTGPCVACTRDNIITPRLDDGHCNPLLLPKDRIRASELICRGIRVKPAILEHVAAFQSTAFKSQMIGLHIRGPGRIDGGVPELRRRSGSSTKVPVETFFLQVDEALRLLPDAGIFASSDSAEVMRAIKARYPDRLVTYPAQRSDFGEMHANHEKNKGQTFDRYRLGLDVLCEALLLARTDVFVHGNSNVANFVLCKSPHLLHAYVPA